MKNRSVMIVCALPSEAGPLIQYYKLKEWSASIGFKVYGSEGKRLIVTGMGKVSAAAGTAYLGGLSQNRTTGIWLNVGTAGSGLRPVGKGIVAHKIIEESTGKTWYPSMAFDPPIPTDSLTTVEKPANGIDDHSLVDMEASGFYETALRFTESELVQCYKIVSDNRENSPEWVNKKKVAELMKAHLNGIHSTINRLHHLAAFANTPAMNDPSLNDLLNRWHFSEYQKNQIKRLWKKSKTLKLDQTWMNQNWNRFNSGEEVIGYFKQNFQNIPFQSFK